MLKDLNITYHKKESWKNDHGNEYFQSVAKGQEFVVDENTEAEKWTRGIIEKNVL